MNRPRRHGLGFGGFGFDDRVCGCIGLLAWPAGAAFLRFSHGRRHGAADTKWANAIKPNSTTTMTSKVLTNHSFVGAGSLSHSQSKRLDNTLISASSPIARASFSRSSVLVRSRASCAETVQVGADIGASQDRKWAHESTPYARKCDTENTNCHFYDARFL